MARPGKPQGVACEIEGCDRLSRVDGLCSMHYSRRRRGLAILSAGPLNEEAGYGPARKHPLMVRACSHCGGEISNKYITKQGYDRGRDGGIRFCSKACANRSREKKTKKDRHGYIYHYLPGSTKRNQKQIYEHRQVMERMIGRSLTKDETVHHINGVRHDNRPENLELWASRHGKGQRVSDLYMFNSSDLISGFLSMAA
jgi:hypothetical protein